jgi:hypothetical protein
MFWNFVVKVTKSTGSKATSNFLNSLMLLHREHSITCLVAVAKNSPLALEALAGLVSTEDFTAVSLKKAALPSNGNMLPYKDLMLLQVKGRRHVQTRLVEPVASSINSGDNYVLVTPTEVSISLNVLCTMAECTCIETAT